MNHLWTLMMWAFEPVTDASINKQYVLPVSSLMRTTDDWMDCLLPDDNCLQVLPHKHHDLLQSWCLPGLMMDNQNQSNLEVRKCAWWRSLRTRLWWRSWRVGCLPMRKEPSQRPSAKLWSHGTRTMLGRLSRGQPALLEPSCRWGSSCATKRTNHMLESFSKASSTRMSSRASLTQSLQRCQGLASTWWWHCPVSKDGSLPPWMWSLRFCSRTTSPRRWRSMVSPQLTWDACWLK